MIGNCSVYFICGFVVSLLASPSPYFRALSFCWLVWINAILAVIITYIPFRW